MGKPGAPRKRLAQEKRLADLGALRHCLPQFRLADGEARARRYAGWHGGGRVPGVTPRLFQTQYWV